MDIKKYPIICIVYVKVIIFTSLLRVKNNKVAAFLELLFGPNFVTSDSLTFKSYYDDINRLVQEKYGKSRMEINMEGKIDLVTFLRVLYLGFDINVEFDYFIYQ